MNRKRKTFGEQFDEAVREHVKAIKASERADKRLAAAEARVARLKQEAETIIGSKVP
jgi:exonuclease VII small subunit